MLATFILNTLICLIPPRPTRRFIGLVALTWALMLGHASIAGSVAAGEEAPAPDGPDLAATVDLVVSDSPTRVAPSEHGSRLRSHKCSGARSKIALCYNPDCDDETSRDPDDDDDTSHDLNDNGTDVPIVFCFQDIVRYYLIALEAESAPAWTESSYSLFPARQRLRC